MPLIIICGLPSSGKTYRAKQLVSYFEARINGPLTTQSDASIGRADRTVIGPSESKVTAQLSTLNLEKATSSTTSSSPPEGELEKSLPQSVSSSINPSKTTIDRSSIIETNSTRPRLNLKVHHISDHSLHLPRSIYASGAARLEKDGRATLYSAVKRVLSKNDIVILDSGNYIKGWRYQLHCEAKNAGTGSCVVQIGVTSEKCRVINENRLEQCTDDLKEVGDHTELDETVQNSEPLTIGGKNEHDPYDAAVFDELVMRFEEPNPMARWDRPLFAVPWEDAEPPSEEIWREMVENMGKDGKVRVIRPNLAAVAPPTSSSQHLYELDRTTQLILSRIQEYQRDHPDEGGGEVIIQLGGTDSSTASTATTTKTQTVSLTLPTTPLTVPQLQRLRRQFISLHRQQMGGAGAGAVGAAGGALSKERVGELFVRFLESQLGTG